MFPIPRPVRGSEMPRGWKRSLYRVSGQVISSRPVAVGHLWRRRPAVEIGIRLEMSKIPPEFQQVPVHGGLSDVMVPHPEEIQLQMAVVDATQFPVDMHLDLDLGLADLANQWLYGMEPIQVVKINGKLPSLQ